MRCVAYLRVSTQEQDTEKNKADVLVFANEKRFGNVDFIEEKISGRVPWKERKIGKILEDLQEGDILIVPEFSRLSRRLLDCFEIMKTALDKGIKIYAIKENWQLNDSINSQMMAMFLGFAADLAARLDSQRIREGIRARRALGKPVGRPKGSGHSKLDNYKEEIEKLVRLGITYSQIGKMFKVTTPTISKWIRKNGLNKVKGADLKSSLSIKSSEDSLIIGKRKKKEAKK